MAGLFSGFVIKFSCCFLSGAELIGGYWHANRNVVDCVGAGRIEVYFCVYRLG
jgi:hypothetical protein